MTLCLVLLGIISVRLPITYASSSAASGSSHSFPPSGLPQPPDFPNLYHLNPNHPTATGGSTHMRSAELYSGGSPLEAPAAVSCEPNSNKNKSFLDWETERCVEIDGTTPVTPTFDPCPLGTEQDGYDCVGTVRAEPRRVCPASTWPAIGGTACVKAVAYSGDSISEFEPRCPQGFSLRDTTPPGADSFGIFSCVKSINVAPDVISPPNLKSSVGNIQQSADGGSTHYLRKLYLTCPEPTTRVEMSPDGDFVCIQEFQIPPHAHPQFKCREGDVLSQSLGEGVCLSLEVKQPEVQCPRPFVQTHDNQTGAPVCKADHIPVRGATCPGGYILVGRENGRPECHRVVETSPVRHCRNIANSHSAAGKCAAEFDEREWQSWPSVAKSRRDKSDDRVVNRRQKIGFLPLSTTHHNNHHEVDGQH